MRYVVMKFLQFLFRLISRSPMKQLLKSWESLVERRFPGFYKTKLEKWKKELKFGNTLDQQRGYSEKEKLLWRCEQKIPFSGEPRVSVIVPCYNHGRFLRKRLDSIYSQTWKNIEVILLDDGSTDNSVEILKEYQKRYPKRTRLLLVNAERRGTFAQWQTGMEKASGQFIWIAESDDFCDPDFLETMLPYFQYESVMISFCYSVFLKEGKEIGNTREYLSDLPQLDFSHPFLITAHQLVNHGFAVHNVIANVSSAVFRNPGELPEEVIRLGNSMKLSFDWLLYLFLMQGGCCAYSNRTVNYYRIHDKGVSQRIQHSREYYREYAEISRYIIRNYRVDREVFHTVSRYLKRHYQTVNRDRKDIDWKKEYPLPSILKEKRLRLNIIMAVYAVQAGGGEIYPLHLANEMKRQGYQVTVLNFQQGMTDPVIRTMLHPSIPLITVKNCDWLYWMIENLGADVIHSHHIFVDECIGMWFQNHPFHCIHMITLHGIYEQTDRKDLQRVLPIITNTTSRFIFLADKNLEPFQRNGFYKKEQFIKLPNGLPDEIVPPLRREDFGIQEEDFVLVTATRGIPEKGWKEGIQAVRAANKKSGRRIHLLILGDGEMRSALEPHTDSYIHFEGMRNNVRQYYMMADAGLLPTVFRGESYPLTVIECLQCGRPMIVTDIAETRNMLTDPQGNPAGELLTMEHWKLNQEELIEKILLLANNREHYEILRQRCRGASKKFNISEVVRKYIQIYYEAGAGRER